VLQRKGQNLGELDGFGDVEGDRAASEPFTDGWGGV
jgi:hypothetical protein